jgi:quinol monooxygenase YgiN
MYARVFSFEADPKKTDEGIEIYMDGYIPEAEQEPGFIEAILLGDRSTGLGMSISIWESEQAARDSEQNGFVQQVIAKFAGVLTGPPAREGYEIMARSETTVKAR